MGNTRGVGLAGLAGALLTLGCPEPPPERYDIAYIEQGPPTAHLRFMSATGNLSSPLYLPNGMAVQMSGHNSLSWSPDGLSLAFAAGPPADLNLYTIGANGANLRQLTTHPMRDESPSWSPDGTRIVFLTNRHGQRDVYVIDVTSLAETRVTVSSGFYLSPVWAPDNARIAYGKSLSFTEGDEIFIHNLATGTATQIGTISGPLLAQGLQWAPSPNTILFYAPGTWSDVHRIGTDATGLQNLTGDMTNEASSQPAWYAGGQILFIRSGYPATTGLYRMAANGTGKALIGETSHFPWGPVYRFAAVDLPDLVVSSHAASFDTSDPSVPKYLVEFRIRNVGTAPSPATLVYVDALDPDPQPGTSTQRMQETAYHAALAAGEESVQLQVAFDLAKMHAEDVHVVRITADPKAMVTEAFENNNKAEWVWP